jgi:heptosyltransferase-2
LKRILVIRGGAIGDFILTLPALKFLRENFPNAHIEILGYKHIITLADNRYYANATRSIDYAPISRFFARDAELPADLVEYFGSFDLIVSYLFDPDENFAANLKRCEVGRLVVGSPKFHDREHASHQLTKPLQELGLALEDSASHLFPNEEDKLAAAEFLRGLDLPVVAIHPGSGSEKKNWSIQNWIALGDYVLNSGSTLVVVTGEADESKTAQLRSLWNRMQKARFATNLPLPHLAALLQDTVFVGHDSGISHLAAAAGARCILLFGPTDPAVWAPMTENVRVSRAPDSNLNRLSFETVRYQLAQELMRIGIRT